MPEAELLVDPDVSRAKFKREVAAYRAIEDDLIRRGWWLVKAEFPKVLVVFGTPAVKPPAAAFGALLDFNNYDLWPPSVRLVDPFTQIPYQFQELPTVLPRRVPPTPEQAAKGIQPFQPIMQPSKGGPFMCLPGVREYHEHPAHSGDSWLLHRVSGEGTLYFLLDQLARYGADSVKGYKMGMQFFIAGFDLEARE